MSQVDRKWSFINKWQRFRYLITFYAILISIQYYMGMQNKDLCQTKKVYCAKYNKSEQYFAEENS